MGTKTKIGAAAVSSVLLLGAIDKRIDADKVYEQARQAEAIAVAVEASIPYAAPVRHRNNPPVGYLAVMVASVNFYPCQEDDECWDCESMGNRLCADKTPNGGNQSD